MAASAAAYAYCFVFSAATAFACVFSQVASLAAAACANAFVYILRVEGVFNIALTAAASERFFETLLVRLCSSSSD